MRLELAGYIDLPAHLKPGGFDHAAVHRATARLYVAHTANDAIDVLDCAADHYLRSIPNLAGVSTPTRCNTLKLCSPRKAHTIAFDLNRNKVYAFLPQTYRAAVYMDRG